MTERALPTDLLKQARKLCQSLPDAEEYVMVHHPAFRVGKKPFLILGMNQGPTFSVNLGIEAQHDLLEDPRFEKTPYIGQHGWVSVAAKDLADTELGRLVEGSFRRVAGKRRIGTLTVR